MEYMLSIACSHEPSIYGVVVGLLPSGFTEADRALPLSQCEYIAQVHNLQHFEINLTTATTACIAHPFDVIATHCVQGLLRSWVDVPITEINTFRSMRFGWSPSVHHLYSTVFRRFVILVILNSRIRGNYSHVTGDMRTNREGRAGDTRTVYVGRIPIEVRRKNYRHPPPILTIV